jgi:tellurite resistance protein TehA-like permease
MEHRNNLALEITKNIITISMATIGLLVSGAATIFKDSHKFSDFMPAILLLVVAIILAVLAQMALVNSAQRDGKAFGVITDEHMINSSWLFFLAGVCFCAYQLLKI